MGVAMRVTLSGRIGGPDMETRDDEHGPRRASVEADERRLLERASAFEPAALAEIHDRYHAKIYRFIAWKIHGAETVEDLSADVFLRLLEALRTDRGPNRNLGGWLFRVASFVVTDHIRKQYRRPRVGLDEVVLAVEDGLDAKAETLMRQDRVRAAIENLTEDQSMVIALRYGAGLSIRDSAQVMGRSEGAVKQLQARAVAALAHQVGGEVDR